MIGLPILLMVFYSDQTRSVFLVLLLMLTSVEFLSLYYKPLSSKIGLSLFSVLLSVLAAYFAYTHLVPLPILLVLALVSAIILMVDLFFVKIKMLHKQAWLQGVLYTSIPISCLLYFHDSGYFKELLVGTLLLIWISDSGAYFVGKSIGKRKLMPTVSPGKTWEGFYGAGMCAMIFSYILFSVLGVFSFQSWALIGLCVWLFGSIGDLVESKIKRQLNIKDSANILPGHGGFLDRFDGFYFCLPFVTLTIQLTH